MVFSLDDNQMDGLVDEVSPTSLWDHVFALGSAHDLDESSGRITHADPSSRCGGKSESLHHQNTLLGIQPNLRSLIGPVPDRPRCGRINNAAKPIERLASSNGLNDVYCLPGHSQGHVIYSQAAVSSAPTTQARLMSRATNCGQRTTLTDDLLPGARGCAQEAASSHSAPSFAGRGPATLGVQVDGQER